MSFEVPARVRIDDAAALVARGRAAVLAGEATIDLARAVDFDSSLIACLIDWKRQALSRRSDLALINVPPGLRSIASLYGVEATLFA
ncbi:MAG: STAS domain-containing protein [Burkholderiales bacterium]|nr:STAS domain-containing protein [Burkholderiales bacterium]